MLTALMITSQSRDPPVGLSIDDVASSLREFDECLKRKFHIGMKLDVSQSVPLIKLNNFIIYHIDGFARYTLKNLFTCSTMINDEATPGYIARRSFSKTEHIRLQRAFYRFDQFCYVFHSPDGFHDKSHKQTLATMQEDRFLSSLSPWEVEEMACVWHYLRKELEYLFDRLEDNFVKTALEGDHLGIKDALAAEDHIALNKEALDDSKKAHTSQERVNISYMDGRFFTGESNDFFRNHAKRFSHDKHIEYLASMGLAFLHRLFNANPKEQLQIVIQNTCRHSDVKFLSTALNIYCNNAVRRHHDWYADEKTLSKQPQHVRPNRGFQWARKGLVSSYPCRHKGGLRSLGYVFWDFWRLSGILGLNEDTQ